MDRDEGMLCLFFAAEALGMDQYNTQWWLYNEKIGDRWNEMKFNYPLLEGWSTKKTMGGIEWSDYMVAAYFYSFGRASTINNKILFDYNAASNSMRTNDPFTVSEAMLTVLRLYESISGSTPSVPVQEIGTYDKRIITSSLLQRASKLPAPTTEKIPYYAGMNYFRSFRVTKAGPGRELGPEIRVAHLGAVLRLPRTCVQLRQAESDPYA